MPGILAIALIISIVAYLLFAEFVARHTERRYQTDIDGDESNLLIGSEVLLDPGIASPAVESAAIGSWKGWRKMVVASIQDESSDCRSFKLQPLDCGVLPRFLGGQSIQIRIPGSDPSACDSRRRGVSRCYSLSSGPGEDGYRITVRRVPGGRFSNRLHDTISVGDVVEIKAPRGQFHINRDAPQRPLHLIAAGIGITPMLSMLLHSLEETPSREVHLYYQLRDETNTPFLRALRFLNDSMNRSSLFGLHVWFSQPINNQTIGVGETVGRVTADQITSGLFRTSIDGDYRICGPVDFMESMADGLIAWGVNPDSVQYESFGGQSKRPSAISMEVITGETRAAHRVKFMKSDTEAVFDDATSTLLELAEASCVPVESSCRSGMCGSCVHRLANGQVQYTDQPQCEFSKDEVVLCMAQPTSEVEINA